MVSANQITERITQVQETNNKLRQAGVDVPGEHEIDEVLSTDLDIEWTIYRHQQGVAKTDETELWQGFLDELNGRKLSHRAVLTLMLLADRYTMYEVMAIVDNINIIGITLEVAANDSALDIKWQVISA